MKKTLTFLSISLMALQLQAATNYWDSNTETPGAGSTPTGTWGSSAFWSTSPEGTNATSGWTAGDVAIFSAGTDATNAFTATLSGTQTAGGLDIEEGLVTLGGTGAVGLGANAVHVRNGATLATSSSARISATTGSTITLHKGTARTTNTGAAGSFVDIDMTMILDAGGTIDYTVANVLNIIQTTTTISGTGPLFKTGVGVIAIASQCSYSGPTFISDGELRIRGSSNRLPTGTDVIVSNPGILNLNGVSQQIGSLQGDGSVGLAGATLTIGGSSNTTFFGSIKTTANAGGGGSSAAGGNVTKQGAGVLTLSGTNSFTGLLSLTAGGIIVNPDAVLCDPVCDVSINGGSLTLSNAAQGVENLYGSGGIINLASGHILTINPVNAARSATYSGAIAGAGGITKIGAPTEALIGTNSYTGPTTVTTGKLIAGTVSTGGGDYTIADLAGVGVRAMAPASTLNVNNLTLGVASSMESDFNAFGSSPALLNVAGTLDLNFDVLVDVKGFDTPLTANLLTYSGQRPGLGNFVLGNLPPRFEGSLMDDKVNKRVQLVVTNTDSLVLVSDGIGNWDANNAGNMIWKLASNGTQTYYQENLLQGDVVLLDDTASGVTSLALPGSVIPFRTTITNSAKDYTLNGPGRISGQGSLVKSGSGGLAINSTNDYSGGTTLNAGTISVGNNSAFGTGKLTYYGGLIRSDSTTARTLTIPVDLKGDLTLGDSVNTGDLTFSTGPWTICDANRQITVESINASISSAIGQDVSPRGLTKAGAGVLNLTGANTFSGGLKIRAGTVRVNGSTGLGAANSPVVYSDGVTISTTAGTARTITYAHQLTGDLTIGQSAGGTAALTLAGSMDLNGAVRTITVSNAADTISAVVTNGGIIKNGAGTLTLSATNAYNGNTTIDEGTLSLTGVSSGSGNYFVNPGTTLLLNGTATLGNGTGTLNLQGGRLMTSAGRNATPIPNPVVMTADTTFEGNTTGSGLRDLPFSGSFTATGTLTMRNTNTATGFWNLRFQAGGLNFNQPIVLGVAGDTGGTQLTSYHTNGSADQAFSGPISGTGRFYRAAAVSGTGGKTFLSGDNSYTGGTYVDDGTLVVNNTVGSGTGSGPVNVTNANGILAGVGTIGGPVKVSNGGKIAPGSEAGALTLNNGLDLSSGGVFQWKLAADSTDSAAFGRVHLGAGDLVLGGTSKLSVNLVGAASSPNTGNPFWNTGHTWKVISLIGATNPGDTVFQSVIGGVYQSGYFSTETVNGEVLVNYTAGSPPQPEISGITGLGTPTRTIAFSTNIKGASYVLQFKDDLNDSTWQSLGSVIGDGNPASLNDTTAPVPSQRFYRVIVQ